MSLIQLKQVLNCELSFKKCVNKIPINTKSYDIDEMTNNPWKRHIGMEIPTGYVVIDIDDIEQAQVVSNWLNEEKVKRCEMNTKHGKHFIFKTGNRKFKNQANVKTYLHDSFFKLDIDIRAAENNNRKAGYIILPENDLDRKYVIIEEPNEIPPWLLPAPTNKQNSVFDLSGQKGGRNNNMLKYTLHLRDFTNLSPTKIKHIMKFINSKWETPLKFEEMEIVTRDENVNKPNKNDTERDIALQILDEYQIRKYMKNLYMFTGSIYEYVDEDFIRSLVLKEYNDTLKYSKRNEIYKFIYDFLDETIEDNKANKFLLATPNSIIDLRDSTLLNNDGTIFITSGINYDYHEGLNSEFAEEYMDNLFGEHKNMIYEAIGYSFLRTLSMRHSFWLIGPHGTGKSFFIEEVLPKIFTTVSNLDIHSLQSNFGKHEIMKSIVNITDEVSLNDIDDSRTFKAAISGTTINTDVKNKDRLSFRPISTWWITGNDMPKFNENDDAIYSRIVIIPVVNKIEKDPFFEDKINDDVINHIVNKAIEFAKIVIERGYVENTAKDALETYIEDVDIVREFINEFNLNKHSVKEVFFQFKTFCYENSYKVPQKREFEHNLKNKGYQKIYNESRKLIWSITK